MAKTRPAPGRSVTAGLSARAEAARRRRARRTGNGVAVVLMALGLAAMVVSFRWCSPLFRPSPAVTAGAEALAGAALAGALAAAVMTLRWRGSGRWERGAAGESATAAALERLSPRRWLVLHDLAVPGSRANIDHLVIGPTGVWVVDSKAYRAGLRVKRGRLWAGKVPVVTDAVRWEAEVVSGLLGAPARAVVAVHGPRFPGRGRRCQGVPVVPAQRLVRRLRRGQYLRRQFSRGRAQELCSVAEANLPPRYSRSAIAGRQGRRPLVSK